MSVLVAPGAVFQEGVELTLPCGAIPVGPSVGVGGSCDTGGGLGVLATSGKHPEGVQVVPAGQLEPFGGRSGGISGPVGSGGG